MNLYEYKCSVESVLSFVYDNALVEEKFYVLGKNIESATKKLKKKEKIYDILNIKLVSDKPILK